MPCGVLRQVLLPALPGVSRAGAVIIVMLLLGYKRDESAIYSFLLALPTIGAASLFDLYKNVGTLSSSITNIQMLIIGFIVRYCNDENLIFPDFISFS